MDYRNLYNLTMNYIHSDACRDKIEFFLQVFMQLHGFSKLYEDMEYVSGTACIINSMKICFENRVYIVSNIHIYVILYSSTVQGLHEITSHEKMQVTEVKIFLLFCHSVAYRFFIPTWNAISTQ